eukprot:gene15470-32699_t
MPLPVACRHGGGFQAVTFTQGGIADAVPATQYHRGPFSRYHRSVRLNSIKLSGFKSFAEPTNFLLPGQLVGVVGPNGCGKSNIMDAVRWVLGESKASELRGESMQDVIFNGTTTRKPA